MYYLPQSPAGVVEGTALKICFIGMEFVPTDEGIFIGGTANNAVRLAGGLANRGHRIHVITIDTNGVHPGGIVSTPWGEIDIIPGSSRHASLRSGLESFIKISCHLLRDHRREKFDVVHTHFGFPVVGLLNVFCSLFRLPSLFTLYSSIQPRTPKDRMGFPQLLSSPFFSKLFLRAGAKSAVSRNTINSLVQLGFSEEEIFYLPSAVDITKFNPSIPGGAIKRELRISKEVPTILYLGNWAVWKGIDTLIESMSRLSQQFPNVKLITAWGMPYQRYAQRREKIRSMIESLGLRGNIVEVYEVRNVAELIAACDVVTAPSLNTDGVADYPLSILDAMACGKPVVATAVGGIPEVIHSGQNGLLVEPGDSSQLAKALSHLLTNKEVARRMGEEAAKYVAENFDLNRVASRLEEIYRNISGSNDEV